jgi:hypothetical protein
MLQQLKLEMECRSRGCQKGNSTRLHQLSNILLIRHPVHLFGLQRGADVLSTALSSWLSGGCHLPSQLRDITSQEELHFLGSSSAGHCLTSTLRPSRRSLGGRVQGCRICDKKCQVPLNLRPGGLEEDPWKAFGV